MSKTICKCGTEYEHSDSLPDEKVDACGSCSKYARATYEPSSLDVPRVRVIWETKNTSPGRVIKRS